jgi:hypothetical protein
MERRLNEKEAAHFLSYSVHWMRRCRCRGGGPTFTKLDTGRILYQMSDLEEWIEQHEVRVTNGARVPKKRGKKKIERKRLTPVEHRRIDRKIATSDWMNKSAAS